MKELLQIANRLRRADVGRGALATLVAVEGSSYRRTGARLLWLTDGTRLGSISGGCLEEDLLTRVQRVARDQMAETVIYDTTSENDLVWGVGLGCHGIVRVFIEPINGSPVWAAAIVEAATYRRPVELAVVWDGANVTRATQLGSGSVSGSFRQTILPPLSLLIFGAGDDVRPLVALGRQLGWRITVADCRPAFATRDRFRDADDVLCQPIADLIANLRVDPWTVAVLMTHHYVHDRPLLRAILPLGLPFVGLLGPRKRAEKILADVAADGLAPTPEMLARLHAPVGLDIGADGADQVALSIVSEIQAVLTARDGRSLRHRHQPIHSAVA